MKRRIFSALLALVMVVAMVPAMATPASAASYPLTTVSNLKDQFTGIQLFDGVIYKVSGDIKIDASKTSPPTIGIEIPEGATVVIYLDPGSTLTVKGGPSKAGIELHPNATLIFTGSGTVNVTGGDATSGENGGRGADGKSGEQGYGGSGGQGGDGAGAGIGRSGSPGAAGGQRSNNSGGGGNSGFVGSSADYTSENANMGDLYVLGAITLNVKGGSAADGGSGGYGGSNNNSQTGGGGGGGGGGGSVAYDIGGGGFGGGGGGGGSSGKHSGSSDTGKRGSNGTRGWDSVPYSLNGGFGGDGGRGGDASYAGAGGGWGPRIASGGTYQSAVQSYIDAANTGSVYCYSGSSASINFQGISASGKSKRNVTMITRDQFSNYPVLKAICYTMALDPKRPNTRSDVINLITNETFNKVAQYVMYFGVDSIPNYNRPLSTTDEKWKLSFEGYTLDGLYEGTKRQFYGPRAGNDAYTYDRDNGTLSSWSDYGMWTAPRNVTLTAKWTPDSVQVRYNPNGGVGNRILKMWTYDQTPPSLSEDELPTRTGYTLLGYWTRKDSGGTQLTDKKGVPLGTSTLTAITDTYARWEPITYRIELYDDNNNLIGQMDNVKYDSLTLPGANGKVGSSTVFSTTLSKSGHVFVGWSTVPGLSAAMYEANKLYTVGLKDTQNAIARLYPAWRAMDNYTVTYDANGGTGAPAAATVREDNSGYTVSSAKPTRDGYTFQGWATTPTATAVEYKSGASYGKVTADVTLYAVWKPNPSVTYDANGGYFTTSLPVDYPSPAGTYTLTNTVPVREGYDFKGWKCSKDEKTYNSGEAYALRGSYDALTFTAQWEKKIFHVTVNADAGITVTDGLAGGYEYGADRPFTATGDGTVRVYANGVLLSPQDDGQYHITVTQDIEIKITLTKRVEYYIVSYDANGGVNAPFDRGEYAAGDPVTVGAAPTREGYTFTGWSDGAKNYLPDETFPMGSGDVTLTAQWKANRYSIVYDANGGAGDMAATELNYDDAGTIAACTYQKTGCRFTGWALSPDGLPVYLGGETVRNLTAEADGEINLYARWTAKEYTVTLDAMGGTPAKSYVKATYGAEMPAIALPTRTGYIFGGYYDDPAEGTCYYDDTGASPVSRWDKAADATLYARWSPIRYKVEYELCGGTGSALSRYFGYDERWSLPKASDFTSRDGYRFAGWALSENGSVVYQDGAEVEKLTSEDGATVKLYAVWEPLPTYTLHYDANGGTAAPADASALEGDDCTVSDQKPVYNGYRFLGWSTDPAATQPDDAYAAGTPLTMTGDLTLYAVWYRLKTYTITYDPGVDDGSVSNLPASGTKTEDEPYLISSMTPVREGYDFRGWSTMKGGEANYPADGVYEDNKPLTLYAVWEARTYGLTLRDNGVGTITVRRGSETLPDRSVISYGDVLDITAEPLNGYSTAAFWCLVNGSIVTTGDANQITTRLTVTGDVAVTLLDRRSTELRYTVKYDPNGGTGTIEDQTVKSTETTQLSDGAFFSKEHARIVGWNTAADGSGTGYALGAVLTAPIAADGQTVTLYAVWQTDETYTVSYDPNGGIGAPTDETAHFENDTVTVSTDTPTRKGYDFKGWSDGSSIYQPGETFAMPAGNVRLTAQWEREKYTVTVDDGGVATVTIKDERSEYPGDTVIHFTVEAIEPNVLSRLTVAVNGSVMHLTEENGVPTGSFVLTQNSTITVRSGATTYTVSYDANGGTPAQAETATCITGESVTLHSGAGYARDGYHITGWNTAPDGSGTAYALGALVAGFDADTTLYAVWADDRGYGYTIVYNANGGDGNDFVQDMYENVLSTPLYDGTGFTKVHARIAGWNTAADGSGTGYALGAVLTAPIAADGQTVTLYAVWQTDETYTVSYDPNGGIGAPTDETAYFENDTVTVIFTDTPTRGGWTFLGWDTDRSARTPTYTTEGDSFTMGSANVTLYAIWQQNASTYTVRYDANGGTGIPTDGNAYLSGDTVTVKFTPQPTRPDWTFLGWARSSTAATPEFTTARGTFQMGSGDVTLYAVWQKIQSFTVTYDANAGGELVTALPGAGSKTAGVDYTVSPTVPARSGYTFLGWSRTADGAVEFAPGAAYTADADLTLYAVWERIAYTVSFDDGGVADVALTTNPNQNRFPGGTTVEFTVTALDPNVLGSLTVAVNGAVMQMTEANGVLTGSFVLERDSVISVRSGATTYAVAYDANGGDAPAQAETVTYVTGTTLVLHDGTGFTMAGYHITGWNTASDGSGDAYALAQVLTSDLSAVPTLYAVWEADPDARGYSYTVSYDPNGGTGTVQQQTLYQNELTTPLFASADVADFAKDGYTLIGWTTVPGGAVVSYALGSTLPAPLASAGQTVTLYAVWQRDEITVTLSDPQKVCTVPSISVRLGSPYGALPALTKDGWTFNGWYNERGEKIESTTLVTNGAPHTLYARWTSNSGGGVVVPKDPEKVNGYDVSYKICPRDKTCPAYRFRDLDLKLWYHDGIHFCVENELMQGLPEDLFDPNGETTRAQIVMILWRLEGQPYVERSAFADVSDGDWFAPALNWAAANEIVLGYADSRFGPNDTITREQFAAILYRYARYRVLNTSEAENTDLLSYEDVQDVSPWAVPAMQWACGSGIINGVSECALWPKETATRAQTAAMIMRFLVGSGK